MLEYMIAVILILLTILLFLFFRKGEEAQTNTRTKKEEKNKSSTLVKNQPQLETKSTSTIPREKFVDPKSCLINSFREGKDVCHPFITRDGKTILYHDEKRIFLCNLNSFSEKNPKFLTKTVEQDVICDASYSQDKK